MKKLITTIIVIWILTGVAFSSELVSVEDKAPQIITFMSDSRINGRQELMEDATRKTNEWIKVNHKNVVIINQSSAYAGPYILVITLLYKER